MDTLSKRLCIIAVMVNVIFMGLIYFTRSFYISLGEISEVGNQPHAYFPSITNNYFYDILSSGRVTVELIFIVTLTIMFSLAFMRMYKSNDKSTIAYSGIMITLIVVTDFIVHMGFSLIKGSELFTNLWIEGLVPITSALEYTVLVAILYVACTFINKKKGKKA